MTQGDCWRFFYTVLSPGRNKSWDYQLVLSLLCFFPPFFMASQRWLHITDSIFDDTKAKNPTCSRQLTWKPSVSQYIRRIIRTEMDFGFFFFFFCGCCIVDVTHLSNVQKDRSLYRLHHIRELCSKLIPEYYIHGRSLQCQHSISLKPEPKSETQTGLCSVKWSTDYFFMIHTGLLQHKWTQWTSFSLGKK